MHRRTLFLSLTQPNSFTEQCSLAWQPGHLRAKKPHVSRATSALRDKKLTSSHSTRTTKWIVIARRDNAWIARRVERRSDRTVRIIRLTGDYIRCATVPVHSALSWDTIAICSKLDPIHAPNRIISTDSTQGTPSCETRCWLGWWTFACWRFRISTLVNSIWWTRAKWKIDSWGVSASVWPVLAAHVLRYRTFASRSRFHSWTQRIITCLPSDRVKKW